jgi:DNA recombination protein RmuC
MSPTQILVIAIVAAISALLGWLIAHLRAGKTIAALRESQTELQTRLHMTEQSGKDLDAAREELSNLFSKLSNDALKHNNESFLKLAQENLKQYQVKAEGNLKQREQAIEQMVKPIRDALDKTEHQIRQMEKERQQAFGSLNKHLETMAHMQQQLQHETANLTKALRRPEVRGRWGEMTLKRLAELAGMVEYCDFFEQEHTNTEQGAIRPDMIVRMPDKREIVVDVKTPLDAYLEAVEAVEDKQRDEKLVQHARNVRKRVRELSGKAYWDQFKNSPDFVVLFIPGDQFLTAALEKEPDLLEDAMAHKVILATPTSFVALLRAVAFGWRQEAMAENADHIRDLGEDLYKRLNVFIDHMSRLGKSLGSSVDTYNKAVGSLERNVLPGARKMEELGIHARKSIEDLESLDKTVRDTGKD